MHSVLDAATINCPHNTIIIPIITALIGIIGTAFGGWLVHRFTVTREREVRKRAFRAAIRSIQYELAAIQKPDQSVQEPGMGRVFLLDDWQVKMLPEVRERCAAALEDVPFNQRAALEALLMQFSSQRDRLNIHELGKHDDRKAELHAILESMIKLAS